MTVGTKAILIELTILGTFVAAVSYLIFAPSPSSLTGFILLVPVSIFGTWLWTLNCPRCGHSIKSRPLRSLHDFPVMDKGFVFHRRCRWCGCDLRSPSHDNRHQPKGWK